MGIIRGLLCSGLYGLYMEFVKFCAGCIVLLRAVPEGLTGIDNFRQIRYKHAQFPDGVLSSFALADYWSYAHRKMAHRITKAYLFVLLGLLGIIGQSSRLGADSNTAGPTQSPWRLGAAFGYGQRSNPLVFSDDITILVDLDIAWFGERWFFDNGDVGYTVADNDRYTLSLVARVNSDRVFFSKTNSKFISINNSVGEPVTVKVEVPDRDYAVETGVEFLTDGDWGSLQMTAFQDVSGKHNGYELYADYSYSLRRQRWLYQPSFGVSWKSGKLNNYYWGVRESEANPVFPVYRAGSGLNAHARFLTSFQINRHWALVGVAEFERLNSATASSPIVKERTVIAMFAGFKYQY